MVRMQSAVAGRLDFGDPRGEERGTRLRLVSVGGEVRGPEKYRLLAMKRRRAQIRARRLVGFD